MRGTEACVGCALCLPVCPTYQATREEGAGARGKIALLEALATGRLHPADRELARQLEDCTGCWACERACPAGVATRDLFLDARAKRDPTPPERLLRAALAFVYASPARARRLLGLLFLPLRGARTAAAPRPAAPARPGGEALLPGCLARWAVPDAARGAAGLMDRLASGWRAVPDGLCCGAPLVNNGLSDRLGMVAGPLLDWLERTRPERLVTPDATCAATLRHEWPSRLPAALAARWRPWAERVATLQDLAGNAFPPRGMPLQPSCHRLNAPGGPDPENVCCGFGGTFSVQKPKLARRIGLARLSALGPGTVAVEGPGCLAHLRRLLPRAERSRLVPWTEAG